MLDFNLDLQGPFIENLRAYQSIMKMCAMQKMEFMEALKVARERFPDLDGMQMFELRYEMHELHCIQRSKERNGIYDIDESTGRMLAMLDCRNDEEFYPRTFIQAMGRGMRMQSPEDLIGKPFSIKLGKITRKGKGDEQQ